MLPLFQEGDRRMKMQNMVKFPLMGMDMAPHMVKRSQSSWSLPSHWSPWRRPYGLGRNPDDYLYDLYAVCNHHGNMHGGHYTAYCKNSIDGQWYCFDDSEVSPVPDEDVCQQTAYILFYQRRTVIPSWSANSSVAGSTSSSLCDHWINRLPGSRPASLASGASSRRTSLASLAESVEFPVERNEDDGGFSIRPFVRSIQRQSLSSRSSIASPLAFSDSGVKPSWSLASKLQMRSNSPSRFSLDSRCSPPLERIGEACDDKVSTSCFGSYSRHERYFGSRSPLSMMESNFNDQDNNKRFIDMVYCRAPTPVEKKSTNNEATENNNQISAVDQNVLPAQATPSKEQKRKSSIGGFASKAESTGSTKSSNKVEQEKTSKKRLCSIHKATAAETSTSTPVKGKKLSNTKEKTVSAKKSISTPSGTPSKTKVATQPLDATPQRKPSVRSTPQSSASPSPTAKKNSNLTENSCSRKRLVERSFSRDSMHTSPLVDSLRDSLASRSSFSKSGESNRPERRSVRSSSSSSSVTSLRSPSVSARDLQRSSKSEEKGLSFLRSALRQRESRRSADLGKSTLVAKKASERTCKQNGQAKDGGGDAGKKGDAVSPQAPTENKSDTKESFRPPSSLSRSLLNVGKSKSSTSEVSLKSPANGKKPLERMASSRKLSSSTQSPARTTKRPQ
ncbi:ubiquitin carboxyl-terminal hydrolase 31-like [Notothenia coriiceps]|uniref:ubiquitinyl hydrolase 1 n=1 Tax=Notothenia coriiceps TaxID=8208 RepID=A0A6I9PAI0_9TELE|nr:PREDICTED: ubiquitin carboxyl-terminal hydrolase 31-like [Notothenia coriiceps]